MHKSATHQLQNRLTDANHDTLQNQHNRLKRHANTSHIAFSVYLGHDILHTAPGDTIKCDQIILNDGNGYNSHTGIFTARITGVYLFSFSVAVYDKARLIGVKLVVDNRNIVDAVVGSLSTSHTMSRHTAIAQVNENESVWLEAYASLDGEVMDKCHNWNTGSLWWKDLPDKMYMGHDLHFMVHWFCLTHVSWRLFDGLILYRRYWFNVTQTLN